jgi:hypothetical protein
VNGEGAVEADAIGVFAQQPRSDGVKGARSRDVGRGASFQRHSADLCNAAAHFGCGTTREGQEHDAARS